jgi:hypothetical protein
MIRSERTLFVAGGSECSGVCALEWAIMSE